MSHHYYMERSPEEGEYQKLEGLKQGFLEIQEKIKVWKVIKFIKTAEF